MFVRKLESHREIAQCWNIVDGTVISGLNTDDTKSEYNKSTKLFENLNIYQLIVLFLCVSLLAIAIGWNSNLQSDFRKRCSVLSYWLSYGNLFYIHTISYVSLLFIVQYFSKHKRELKKMEMVRPGQSFFTV